MNSLVIGGILKKIYTSFDMASFDNRLKLQKIIYLVQAYGINLGYTFNLYVYGPYSPELTKTGFYMEDFNSIKEIGFEEDTITKKFDEFKEKIEPFKDNLKWLEIASTIHLFKQLSPSKNKVQIVSDILKIKTKFTKNQIEKVWEEILGWLI